MFERFTDEARMVVRLAQEEARRMRHPLIGTEHLLLALLGEGDGPGRAGAARPRPGRGRPAPPGHRHRRAGGRRAWTPRRWRHSGIDLDEVRRVTEASFGPGALDATRPRAGARRATSRSAKRSKKVLELSLREALRLGHHYIGTGHILLGLLREGEGLGRQGPRRRGRRPRRPARRRHPPHHLRSRLTRAGGPTVPRPPRTAGRLRAMRAIDDHDELVALCGGDTLCRGRRRGWTGAAAPGRATTGGRSPSPGPGISTRDRLAVHGPARGRRRRWSAALLPAGSAPTYRPLGRPGA